jgi:hypothetical protein
MYFKIWNKEFLTRLNVTDIISSFAKKCQIELLHKASNRPHLFNNTRSLAAVHEQYVTHD